MANGGAWGVRNRGGGAYNPDCDFCEVCGYFGHDPEDCINPPLEVKDELLQEEAMNYDTQDNPDDILVLLTVVAVIGLIAWLVY
jgi:hypothetical protein